MMKYLFQKRERATNSCKFSQAVVCYWYASTLADLDSIVVADYGAISLTKPGSSVAQIKGKEYFYTIYLRQC